MSTTLAAANSSDCKRRLTGSMPSKEHRNCASSGLHAAREERQRATRLTEATLNEYLEALKEGERLNAESKRLKQQIERLREERQPGGPGESEPHLQPRFDLQPIERKPFHSPPGKMKGLPPQIDDMPPLGPVAFASETPMISARA